MHKGYFHVQLAKRSQDYTTTLTHQGLFWYKHLLMGLTDSGVVFQQLVAHALTGVKGAVAYIDDILIYRATKEAHNANLDAVLSWLAVKDFHLHLSRCQFAISKLTFLGHIISSEGIEPDPKNVQPILDAPAPSTILEVKSWMGMVRHYSDFVPDLATIAEPLR